MKSAMHKTCSVPNIWYEVNGNNGNKEDGAQKKEKFNSNGSRRRINP